MEERREGALERDFLFTQSCPAPTEVSISQYLCRAFVSVLLVCCAIMTNEGFVFDDIADTITVDDVFY
jgi:hypothetical protein